MLNYDFVSQVHYIPIYNRIKDLGVAYNYKNDYEFYNKTAFKVFNKFKNIEESKYNQCLNVNTYDSLVSKMLKSYNDKSINQLKYFLFNVSQKVSKKSRLPIINFKSNPQSFFTYRKNIDFSLTPNDEIKMQLKKELIQGEFLRNADKKYSSKKVAKIKYLEYYNRYTTSYFLTFTLDSHFHKYKMKSNEEECHSYDTNNNLTLNKNYNFDENFEENLKKGFKQLNEIHRFFYRDVKQRIKLYNRKNKLDTQSIDFIKMIEPHESLTAHEHSLFWIDDKYEKFVYAAYENTIKKFRLKEKYQKIKKIESLDEINKSTDKNLRTPASYVTKYIAKGSTEENEFFNVYKRYFGKKYRFFSSSNFKHINQRKINLIYKDLQENKKGLLERFKKSNKPLYYWLEKLELWGVYKFDIKVKTKFSIDLNLLSQGFEKLYSIEKHKRKIYINKTLLESKENMQRCNFSNDLSSSQKESLKNEFKELQSKYLNENYLEDRRKEKLLKYFLKNTKNFIKERTEKVIISRSKFNPYFNKFEKIYHENMYIENNVNLYSFKNEIAQCGDFNYNDYTDTIDLYKSIYIKS